MVKNPDDAAGKEDERDEFLDGIGQRIKLARTRAKLTQKELAKLLSTNQSWIYMAEDGQQNLQLGSLRKIAQILGVSVRDLIPDTQNPVPEFEIPFEIAETFRKLIFQLTEVISSNVAERQKGSDVLNDDPSHPTEAA